MKRVVAALSFLFVANAAYADDANGFYLGAQLGVMSGYSSTEANDMALRLSGYTNVNSKMRDSGDVAGKAILGYRLGHFAIEGHYFYSTLSQYSATFDLPSDPLRYGTQTKDRSVHGPGVSLLAFIPITSSLEAFGRVGYYRFTVTVDTKTSVGLSKNLLLAPDAVASTESSTHAASNIASVGAGVALNLPETGVSLRAEFEAFGEIGKPLGDEGRVTNGRMMSISAVYRY